MIERERKPKIPLEERRSPLAILLFIAVILYIFFLLGKSIWQHYQLNNQIKKIEDQIAQLEAKNWDLQEQIKYYQSDAYKEKEAREKLGYQKPGETVIALPPPPKKEENKTSKTSFSQPNWQRWWNFFFK